MIAKLLQSLGLIALPIWIGATIWFLPIQTPIFFREFKSLAPELQNALFPRYWVLSYICLGTALLGVFFRCFRDSRPPKIKVILLAVCVLLLSMIEHWLAPKIDELGSKLNTVSENITLRKEFGKWHGLSMMLNTAVFVLVVSISFHELACLTRGTPQPSDR